MSSLRENVTKTAFYYAARANEYHDTTGYGQSTVEAGYAQLKAAHRETMRDRDVIEVACGTGYWTAVIASSAHTVLATDIHPELVEISRQRLREYPNVRCQVADAYALDFVDGDFSGAFAHYWWSHIPRKLYQPFLDSLHRKLRPGALVSFTDNLPYEADWVKRRIDEHGDTYEERSLRDGSRFETIKNFPSQAELSALLEDVAEDMIYAEYEIGPASDGPSRLWNLTYRLRK